MDVAALLIQRRVFKTVRPRRKELAWGIGGVGGSVQMMAEFGGRIARGHPEKLADLRRTLLVVGGVNYG